MEGCYQRGLPRLVLIGFRICPLKCIDCSIFAFIKYIDGSILVPLKCINGFWHWPTLSFPQSSPTQIPECWNFVDGVMSWLELKLARAKKLELDWLSLALKQIRAGLGQARTNIRNCELARLGLRKNLEFTSWFWFRYKKTFLSNGNFP